MAKKPEPMLPLWRCPGCDLEIRALGNAVGHPCKTPPKVKDKTPMSGKFIAFELVNA